MTDRKKIARIIDANLNRAREGARVLEEIARFVSDDKEIAGRIKDIRHLIVETTLEFGVSRDELLDARDSDMDVGRKISGELENKRADIMDIIASNFSRIEEALRAIEEFGKLINPTVALKIKDIRYDVYSLERDFRK
ncbi:MAG: thiamine-phosphate pyrophosphorylase [bacterium]